MNPARTYSFLTIVTLLCACDSNGLVVPEGPEKIRVDLQYNFDDDLVVIELDGYRVFRERVTTEHVLSLAEWVNLELPEGEHEIRVAVNRHVAASKQFAAGEYPVIAVTYDRDKPGVWMQLLEEPPYYD